MRRLLVLGTLVLAGSAGSARAASITFEDHAVAAGTANPALGNLTSAGFLFTQAFYQLANNSANIDDGSTYFVIEGTPSLSTMTQVGGEPFTLLSFDYAKWQGPTIAAATITVTGNRVGGGTVVATLSPGGDFTPAGPDFQTFNFGSAWTNLLSVSLLGTGATFGTLNYFAIDNVTVATVPEPASMLLLGTGLTGLLARSRTRRS